MFFACFHRSRKRVRRFTRNTTTKTLKLEPLEPRTLLASDLLPVDDLLLVSEDEALTFDYLLLNDSGVDSIVSTTNPLVGSLSTSSGESFTYTHDGVGDDSFAYTVADGQESVSVTVNVSVNAAFDVRAARDAILAGVTHLANPTQPR